MLSQLAIKKKIQLKKGKLPDRQRLIYEGCELEDQFQLWSYGISVRSTLYSNLRLLGGMNHILFNSLDQPVIKKLTKTATCPNWRTVGHGLNLEGTCNNKRCQAIREKVWIIKGFGEFNISKEKFQSKCPACSELCQKVENMGIYQANLVSKGRVPGQKGQLKKFYSQKNIEEFLTFQDQNETKIKWLYLEMKVSRL